MIFSVEITVRGPIDRRTGMVLNITELKEAIETVIMKRLDHKNLDKDVEYFANTVNNQQAQHNLPYLSFISIPPSQAPQKTWPFTSGTTSVCS